MAVRRDSVVDRTKICLFELSPLAPPPPDIIDGLRVTGNTVVTEVNAVLFTMVIRFFGTSASVGHTR